MTENVYFILLAKNSSFIKYVKALLPLKLFAEQSLTCNACHFSILLHTIKDKSFEKTKQLFPSCDCVDNENNCPDLLKTIQQDLYDVDSQLYRKRPVFKQTCFKTFMLCFQSYKESNIYEFINQTRFNIVQDQV